MKIILEREKCIGCGSCQALCPKYFEVIDDGKSSVKNATRDQKTGNDELETEKVECAQEAADSCPVQCIHIIK
jgi:ferredoxin